MHDEKLVKKIAALKEKLGATKYKLRLERDHTAWLQGECDKAVDMLYSRNSEVAAALAALREKFKTQDSAARSYENGWNDALHFAITTIAKLGSEAK